MNYDIVVVNVKDMNIYSFLNNGEIEEELLQRAENYKKEEIESYKRLIKEYSDRECFKNSLKKYQQAEYKVMTYDEFKMLEKKYYISDPIKEVTEEDYEEALNVLPPKFWTTINGVEMFCMSEYYTGTYTTQYAKAGNKYYSKMVDTTDKNTWIYNYL